MSAVGVDERMQDNIIVGRINGFYGVKGWVKVFSHTKPLENILSYSPWLVKIKGKWCELRLVDGRAHGKGIIAQLEGYNDRDQAAVLVGADVAIDKEQLSQPEEGEYYWADLVGLDVVNCEGVSLGTVDHLIETGANDVLVIKGEQEHLVPFVQGSYVLNIDLQDKVIRVDWDPDF